MQRRVETEEYEEIGRGNADTRIVTRKFMEDSLSSTDVSEQLVALSRETLRENKRVVSFTEELRSWQFSKTEVGFMRIRISDYEQMRDRIDALEAEALRRPALPAPRDDSLELAELQEELTFKNDLLSSREKEIAELRSQLQKTRLEGSLYDKGPAPDSLKERLADYRKKFYAERKRVDGLERDKQAL